MKAQLRSWLAASEFRRVVDAVAEQTRIIRLLIALTYDPDPLISWRSIDAIGRCAARLSAIRPEVMKDSLRRLFWMMSDESGSVAWHAPEVIGEIIRSDPQAFADFVPMAVSLLDVEPEDRPPFLPGILYALGRIAEVAGHAVEPCLPSIVEALDNPDPQSRAMAVCCLRGLKAQKELMQHPELAHDQGRALVYRDGQVFETTVSRLRADALND